MAMQPTKSMFCHMPSSGLQSVSKSCFIYVCRQELADLQGVFRSVPI